MDSTRSSAARSRALINGTVDGNARGAALGAAPEQRAIYVYGIIRSKRPLQFEAAGMDEQWPVRTIHHQDLAAVVSDVAVGVVESTRANLLAHERVNAAVLRDHTVIPMSFGMVFRSREDVVELLRSAYDAFAKVLAQMEGKFEFGLKVSFNRGAGIRRIEQEDEDIASQRVAEFLRRLRDVCVASRCNETVGDKMIMNAAFLVERKREAAFEKRLKAIAN